MTHNTVAFIVGTGNAAVGIYLATKGISWPQPAYVLWLDVALGCLAVQLWP